LEGAGAGVILIEKNTSSRIGRFFSHKDPNCIRVTHGSPKRHSVKGMDDYILRKFPSQKNQQSLLIS
jgi:hypothetical protein